MEDDVSWLPLPAAFWLADGASLVWFLSPSNVLTTSPKKGLQGVLSTRTRRTVSAHFFAVLGSLTQQRVQTSVYLQGSPMCSQPAFSLLCRCLRTLHNQTEMTRGIDYSTFNRYTSTLGWENHLNVGSGRLQAGQRRLHEHVSRVRVGRLFLLGDSEPSVHPDETTHTRPSCSRISWVLNKADLFLSKVLAFQAETLKCEGRFYHLWAAPSYVV